MEKTTIQISKNVKEKLDKIKLSKRETYNDIIENLLEDSQQLSAQSIKEIHEALDEIKGGEYVTHEDAKRRLGF